MLVVIELERSVNLDIDGPLLHTTKRAAHEAIVPDIVLGNKEIAADLVAEQQLTLLSHVGGEALWLVRGGILVLRTPLVARRSETPSGK